MLIYDDFDISGFWLDTDCPWRKNVGEPLTDELLASIESERGYTLPASYVEPMRGSERRLAGEDAVPHERSYRGGGHLWDQSQQRGVLGRNFEAAEGFHGGRNPKTGEPIHVEAKTHRTGSRFWIAV